MLHIDIPGREPLDLEHLVCDLNGTLAEDGVLLDGVSGRLIELSDRLTLHLVTADTHGTGPRIVEQLRHAAIAAGREQPLRWQRIATGADKARYIRALGASTTVALGNGANDRAMFRAAALSILVIGSEGAMIPTLLAADVAVTTPLDALDLLLCPDRLVATLRP